MPLSRADAARAALPECEAVVVGDLSNLAEMKSVAAQVNKIGAMDAVVHNVATGYNDRERLGTEDGLSRNFAVNVLATYVLTALLKQPERLIFISSNMRLGAMPICRMSNGKRDDGMRANGIREPLADHIRACLLISCYE